MKIFLTTFVSLCSLFVRSNAQFCTSSDISIVHERMLQEINWQRAHGNSAAGHKGAVKLYSEFSGVANHKITTHWDPQNLYVFAAPVSCTVYNPDVEDCLKKAAAQYYQSLSNVDDNIIGVVEWDVDITESNVRAQVERMVASNAFSFLIGKKPTDNVNAVIPAISHIGLATSGRRIAIIGVNTVGNDGATVCDGDHTSSTTTTTSTASTTPTTTTTGSSTASTTPTTTTTGSSTASSTTTTTTSGAKAQQVVGALALVTASAAFFTH